MSDDYIYVDGEPYAKLSALTNEESHTRVAKTLWGLQIGTATSYEEALRKVDEEGERLTYTKKAVDQIHAMTRHSVEALVMDAVVAFSSGNVRSIKSGDELRKTT